MNLTLTMTENERKLKPFIAEFERIRQLEPSIDRKKRPDHELRIDNFFGDLTKIELDPPGKGKFEEDDPTAESLRTRRWIYVSDCGTCIVSFMVKLTVCDKAPTPEQGRRNVFESDFTFTGKI